MEYSKDYMPTQEDIQKVVNLGNQYWLDMLKKAQDLGMNHINTELVTSIISHLNKHNKLSAKQAKVLIIMARSVRYRIEKQQ